MGFGREVSSEVVEQEHATRQRGTVHQPGLITLASLICDVRATQGIVHVSLA